MAAARRAGSSDALPLDDPMRAQKKRSPLASLAGGAMLMFGARMADGCTSGHGLSGTAQGAASSWVFTPLMFGVGSLLARGARRTAGGGAMAEMSEGMRNALGMATGLVFGALLQRGGLADSRTIIGQLHGDDSRVAKTMARRSRWAPSAIAGCIGAGWRPTSPSR